MPAQSAAALPMPTFHHIHLNSVNPEASLEWYAQFWPRGERTTYGGFPAFHDEIYLLYTKVPKQAPGAFDPKLQRAVPQSAFWTFGSTFADTVAMYARLSKLDPKRFQFLPVYIGPDDNVGVHRSQLGPYQGDQILTLTQLRERAEKEKAEGRTQIAGAARRPGLRLPGRSRRHARRVQSRSARELLGPSSLLARAAAVRGELVRRAPRYADAAGARPEHRTVGAASAVEPVRRADWRSQLSDLHPLRTSSAFRSATSGSPTAPGAGIRGSAGSAAAAQATISRSRSRADRWSITSGWRIPISTRSSLT